MSGPMKMVGKEALPLSEEEIAKRDAARAEGAGKPKRQRPVFDVPKPVTRAEFDALKAEVATLKGKK